MTSLKNLLRYGKSGVASPDMTDFDKLLALQLAGGGFPVNTLTGVDSIDFLSDGTPLISWTVIGNEKQTGTPTSSAPITPEETGDKTAQLFDKNSNVVAYYITQTTGVYTATGSTSRSILIPCEPSTSYTIMIPANRTLRIVSFSHYPQAGDSGDKYESQETGTYIEKEYTYTTSSNARYMCVFCYNSAQEATQYNESAYFGGIMLNTGSTAQPYEPYGYKLDISCGGTTQTVYLQEPIRKIGDSADVASAVGTVGTANRPIKKLVLTGTEDVYTVGGNAPFKVAASGLKSPTLTTVLWLCSHYMYARAPSLATGSRTPGRA